MPSLGERESKLGEFVAWVAAHVKGDEKGEAQIFLDRLFRAFGHEGVQEAGATLKERINKADRKSTSIADLVWKPIVLIELKKRGEDLAKHSRQAFDDWTRLVPGRPRYVLLCNFDEIWVYDFETQMDSPLDQVKVVDLATRWGPLAFLFARPETPRFGNDQVEVTKKTAQQLANCFRKMVDPKRLGGAIPQEEARRFILQMLVALFAEDIEMLPRDLVKRLLDDCKSKQDSSDLIGGLFEAMNKPEKTKDDRYYGVAYFNGGLFSKPARVELKTDEVALLKAAAGPENWSKVRPEIFGTIFEQSLLKADRHAFGAHFTYPTDIMKIVGPTIVEPWRKVIEEADSLARLRELWQRMQNYTVLDPACGSGNFLSLAYRELKRLEARLFERMTEFAARDNPSQIVFGFVSARQFFGIDINSFAVELAKVTMMIARKLAIDELHITEHALPLDNLDANFKVADALIDDLGNPTQWPSVDVIIGNPPFLGAKRLKPERGSAYVNAVRRAYPEIPGMADYCVYWFRKGHGHLPACTAEDPVGGRAGLVGTQNIRNNQSRVGGLDHIVKTGTIVEAVENQPWSGAANVHVAIANWAKTRDPDLLPRDKRLWFVENPGSLKKDGFQPASERGTKTFSLDYREGPLINSSLSFETDISQLKSLSCNKNPKRCFQGKIPGYEGFVLDKTTASLLMRDSARVVVPYLTGRELLDEFEINRWIIDFGRRNMIEAATFPAAFRHCEEKVLPFVRETYQKTLLEKSDMTNERKKHLDRWWHFWNRRDGLTRMLAQTHRYIACSRVTRRPILVFVSTTICPSDALQTFCFDDDYSFGILQSCVHFELFRKSSRLKVETDTRYSARAVFEPFPWPQFPSIAQIDAVAAAARAVRTIRDDALSKLEGGLRAVYRTLELPGENPLKAAHDALDRAVLAAYGFSAKQAILAQMLALNLVVARREAAGESVEPPGIPSGHPDPSRLVNEDCLRAD